MKVKHLFLFPLVAILLVGCNQGNNPGGNTPHEEDYSDTFVDDRTGVITDNSGYYKDKGYTVNFEDRGTALRSKLHNLMIDTHTTYTTYSIFKNTDTYKKTSLDPKDLKIVYFYTGKKVSSYGGSREHVWPCANSNTLWGRGQDGSDIGEDYQGGGSDMYHIMPCDSGINTARANNKFTEFDATSSFVYKGDGGPNRLKVDSQGKRVELPDCFKGDAARIICYLWIHYNPFGKENQYTGNLPLMNVVDAPDGYTIEETLAKWNAMDPVDDMELRRNEEVMKVQGNRNPFIDHPEFVWKMFNLGD